jgi:hypothetical protein
MALWGTRDTFSITGTISTTNTSSTVTGSNTTFLTELDVGDTIQFVGGKRIKVATIASNTSLTLEQAWSTANLSASTIVGQDTPKYITQAEILANTIIGLDATETGITANRAKGLVSPGWTKYTTYTDMHSVTRHKSEILTTGLLTGDANDDSIAADS